MDQQQKVPSTQLLAGLDLAQYEVHGSEDDWQKALKSTGNNKIISIKR